MPPTLRQILSEIERRGLSADQVPPQYMDALNEARRREIPFAAAPQPKRNLGQQLMGAADVGLTMISGAVNEAFRAGPAGILATGREVMRNNLPLTRTEFGGDTALQQHSQAASEGFQEALEVGSDAVIRNRGAIGPLTESGRESMQNLAPVFQGLERLTTGAGNITTDLTGSPALGTAVKTGLETLPLGLTRSRPIVGGVRLTMEQRAADLAELNRVAERQGVDLSADQSTQREQIINTANERVGGQTVVGENFDQVQQAVIDARARDKKIVDGLYKEARRTGDNASIYQADFRPLLDAVNETLEGYDIDVPEMQTVRNSLARLEEFSTRDPNAIVTMNEVANFQKRLNRQSPDPSVNSAKGAMARHTRTWLQSLYDRDMISGDQQAVTNWRMANSAYNEFKDTFDENATVARLHEQKTTPEQVKNWIFGSGAVGARRESGLVVEKLGEILGRDSPQFASLRQEVLFDVLEPLLKAEPNFRQFTQRYDQFRRNNPTIERDLLPDSSQALGELRNIAAAVERGETAAINIDLSRGVAVAMFGHGIAQQGFKVNLAYRAINAMRGQASATRQRQIMADMLGYDPNMPLIPLAPALGAGVIQTGIQETE